MASLVHLREGLRMFSRSLRVRLRGYRRFGGNAKQICKKVIDLCWDKDHFNVSSGHFRVFYMRDFGWSVKSLIGLGYREKVLQTLSYALERFSKRRIVATSISRRGIPFNFPDVYAPDSLGFLLYSLDAANARDLIESHRGFLQGQIDLFGKTVLGADGAVRRNTHFSSMRDHTIRDASCYDACMVSLVHALAKKYGFSVFKTDAHRRLITEYWQGDHFIDDLSHRGHIAADANVFPFWLGLVRQKEWRLRAVKCIQDNSLDQPFPLRQLSDDSHESRVPSSWFAPDYEGTTVWTHIGPLFIELVMCDDPDKAEEYLDEYKQWIEYYGTFLEVFFANGQPYRSLWYHSDEGMLWAANYLALVKKFEAL